jgi:hypothetical protein
MRSLFILIFLALPAITQAGYFEVGFAGNYRKLYLPTDSEREAFDATVSYTGSFAYYFAEMAAAELSFTSGQSERFVPSMTSDSRTIYDFELIGFDLVFTFADRKAPFIPYLKAGIAYFSKKEVTTEFSAFPADNETRTLEPTFVPSLGFGMKLRMTDTLAFRIGVEAWSSEGLDNDPRWDVAGRAGISWFL